MIIGNHSAGSSEFSRFHLDSILLTLFTLTAMFDLIMDLLDQFRATENIQWNCSTYLCIRYLNSFVKYFYYYIRLSICC